MMPKTLFDPDVRAGLRGRMETVRPGAAPLWGKMSSGQMLAHLNAALEMALGELKPALKKTPLSNPLVRWLVIYVMKWPRGTPTAPELLATPPGEWQADLDRFGDLLERMGSRSPHGEWPRHPAFGAMTGRRWGDLSWKHVDHHLRQLGA
jgi:hypothetical protein